MKKFFKIAIISLLAVMLVVTMVACNKKQNNQNETVSKLTPDSIQKIKAIEDYGQDKYSKVAAVTYGNTQEQEDKLTVRINQKKTATDPSSATKIFANSEATKIIEQMGKAGLSEDKMKATVAYMAGSADISETTIKNRAKDVSINGQAFQNTPDDWSFFDDWDYYDELKRIVDEDLEGQPESVKNNAEDNVKRQDRNIMRKVFALGLDGAEFGRLATYELDYATDVVEKMANSTISIDNNLNGFDSYSKANLDYETLVYLRAFNQYYSTSTGLADCVRLYGYYYEYNRTSYYSQNDEDFEKQLRYGHMSKYTDNEWLDYVRIQRNTYANAYRYTDEFYEKFYQTHLGFQNIVEGQENIVYGFSANWQGVSYTGEMLKAINNYGLRGQLKFSDWIWCYGGDDTVMKAYNAANTAYEDGKEATKQLAYGTSDAEYDGKFKFEMEQLKAIDYLMTNMTKTELGQTLYFEVYSYSGDVAKTAQEYRKDLVLLNNGKKGADTFKYAHVAAGLTGADAKTYVDGKVNAILSQLGSTYKGQNVSNKASNASSQPWDRMHTEVQEAINHNYTGSAQEKAEGLEDMVIKRHWSCGADIDDPVCPNNAAGHVECTKEYDKSHNISQFASNYQVIVRYMVGKSEITFKRPNNSSYFIPKYTPETKNGGYSVTVGYAGLKAAEAAIGQTINSSDEGKEKNFPNSSGYIESKTVTVNAGNPFNSDKLSGEDKNWWLSTDTGATSSKPAKANTVVKEASPGNPAQQIDYTYSYAFSAWYLDVDLKYAFDDRDEIRCDLILYAGYNVTKSSAN